MVSLQVGHSRHTITPPLGARMAGYASRTEGCKAIHDPLHVNAVALAEGESRALILQFDLCSFRRDTGEALIRAVANAVGLEPERVIANVSHTHAGPQTRAENKNDAISDYLRHVTEQATRAAREAFADLGDMRLFSAGEAPVDVGLNRREKKPDGEIILGVNPEGPSLPVLTAWRFERHNGPDIVLWSVPVHGTTLGGENLEISAEWMGCAQRAFEGRHEGVRSVFLQGCGADQNPYRDERTFERMSQLGDRAARSISDALEAAEPISGTPLRVAFREAAGPQEDGSIDPVPVHGLRLGEAVAVGLGGEAVVEYALHGRRTSQAASTMILGYTDWTVKYLVTAAMLEEGGYEATSYKYFPSGKAWAPEIERVLKQNIDETLEELARA